MKIGILYICTWKYDVFWKDFYLFCEKYFLKGHEKKYFVFTDSRNILDMKNNDNIFVIEQENLWWPDNTLMRFHMFLWQKKILSQVDYLFFCNANLEIKKSIWEEVLPSEKEGLVFVQHPWFYNKCNLSYTYDRNKKSLAYIKKWEGVHYVAWWFNWWRTKDFLQMCHILSKNIDKNNGIVALRHDEFHINKYI